MSENYSINLKPVYSQTVITPDGVKLPKDWSLSWHQVETLEALRDPNIDIVFATQAITALMSQECISHTDFVGASFTELLTEVKSIASDETRLQEMFSQANAESSIYAQTWVIKSGKKDVKKDTKNNKKAAAATE